MINNGQQLLFFLVVACATIVPLKWVVLTASPFYLLEAIYYFTSVSTESHKFIMVLLTLVEMSTLFAIVAFRKNLILEMIVAILSIVIITIITLIESVFIGYVNLVSLVVSSVVSIVAYVAGIILGDILRRKLSYKYYIH